MRVLRLYGVPTRINAFNMRGGGGGHGGGGDNVTQHPSPATTSAASISVSCPPYAMADTVTSEMKSLWASKLVKRFPQAREASL